MYPIVSKIETKEDYEAAIQAAIDDNDMMVFPTHTVRKNGEIVGSISMARIPLVLFWNHKEKVKARDSLIINNTVESILNNNGTNNYFVACNSNSPYYGHVEKFGYKPVWPTNIFVK